MTQLLASLVDGLLIGFVYGVSAMGLTLIWGVMRVINLAHGAIMALSMFGLYFLFRGTDLNPYLGLAIVGAVGLAAGIAIYAVAVQRVINAPHLSSLLATFAVNMMLIGTGTALYTTSSYAIDFDLGSATLGTLTVPWKRLIAAGVALLVAGTLYFFLYRTPPGKAIRAVANNRAAAELMGIPSNRMLALSFGLGTLLAALAGGLIATFFPFTILSGTQYQLNGFVIGVLGGLGNPLGALIGGLLLGSMEGLVTVFLPVSWVPVIEFGLFVLILLVRPSGLLGVRT